MKHVDLPREFQCQHDSNYLTCIILEFVEKIRREEVEIPHFSRVVTEWLHEKADFSQRLGMAREYVEMLKKKLGRSVLEFKFKLETPLSVHARWPYLPMEIGLAWHPILDLPYIPGSSIKGAARAYAELNHRECEKIFGTAKRDSEDGEVGDVVFFDAFPTEVRGGKLIQPDVLTPHYSQDKMAEHMVSPVPLVYPVVAPGAVFTLLVWLRESNAADCVNKTVVGALEYGIGAKVSLGYGILRKI